MSCKRDLPWYKKLVKIEVFNPAFGVLAVSCIKSGKKYNCDYDHFAPGPNITTYG